MENLNKKNNYAFYGGLIYFIILITFLGIKVCAYFGLTNFYGADIIFKIVVQIGLMFVVPICLYKIIFKKSFKQTFLNFGFKKVSFTTIWVSVVAGFFMFMLVNYFSSVWSALLELIGYKFSAGTGSFSVLDFVLNILFIGILPAICEETTHRGLVLNTTKHNGAIRAIVLTGFLFGLMHLNIVQFGYASLVGMLLCVVTLISRSIVPAMIMHFTNNFLSVFITFSQNSTWLKSNIVDFLLSAFSSQSFILTAVMRILIVMLCLYGIVWAISKLFKEGKKLDYLNFKKNLQNEIKKNGLENEIDINNDAVVLGLYREVNMLNLEKQLSEQKISFREILSGGLKNATELVLSEKMTAPKKANKKDYIFYYLALFFGSVGTILTLILGLI